MGTYSRNASATLVNGHLIDETFIFYPYSGGLEPIRTEQDLARLVPIFFEEILLPGRDRLAARKSLEKANQPWWGLIWPREWQYAKTPKLITKYFGQAGSFAWDESGKYVVVVGHGWLPRDSKRHWQHILSDEYALATVAVFATPLGENLLSQVSVQVGGGQWDLSSKYVGELQLLAPTTTNARVIRDLAVWGRRIVSQESVNLEELSELVCGAYGVPVNAIRS